MKEIRITEDVYERVAAQKRPEETFSDVLERLADRRDAFEDGFGALEDVDFESGLAMLDSESTTSAADDS
jgi:predicted CopG family antitoxin